MVAKDLSRRIVVLRPFLIFLIMTTHVHGSLYRPDMQGLSWSLGTYLYALLTGVIATCALPLLSVISGYLAGCVTWHTSYVRMLWNKCGTLLLPMLFWNLIMALWIYRQNVGGLDVRGDLALYPFDAQRWFYALTSIFRIPANPPLYFLRELFLCFLCFPLFKLLARYWWSGLLLVCFVAYCYLSEIHFGFFIRFDIYGFFMLGLLLARHQYVERIEQACAPWVWWIIAAYAVCCLALAWYAFEAPASHFLLLMKMLTLFGPLVFWLIGGWLQRGALGSFLTWLSPASFPVFLGHCVVILLVYNVMLDVSGASMLSDHYSLYWGMCIGLSFALMATLRVVWRWLLGAPTRLRGGYRSARGADS